MGRILKRRVGLERAVARGEEVLLAVAVAAGDVGSVAAGVLERRQLTHRQYNVLRMLRGAGRDGLSHAAIAERLLVRAPDVTRLVDRLARRGWVVREPSESDRRVVLHRITAEGRALLDELDPALGAIHDAVERLLGAGDADTLIALCERLIDGVRTGEIHADPAGEEVRRG